MRIIIGLCIFCLVLFIYLHIQFHLKTGEDLEMYEADSPSKDKLEEICDLRQPVLFDFDCEKIIDSTNRDYITSNYNAFEIKIRNTKDIDTNTELYIPLSVNAAIKLFNEDREATYFSENNMEFLNDTGVIKNFKYNDEFLRPYMVSNCNYDILMGSKNTCTPFRYEVNYRNYFLLTQGSAQVKLTAPHSIKYLSPIYDYENFEFKSPINPWQPQSKYLSDFEKIKCLEFTLLPGKTLYIPAYWFYSIKFNDNTSISCFSYRTYMNNIAILPYIGLHALQIQNVKRDVVKKADINELNKREIIYPVEEFEIASPNNVDNGNTVYHENVGGNIDGTNVNELPEPISESNLGTDL